MFAALLHSILISINAEIRRRDAEIVSLKTALKGAQDENTALWGVIERNRDKIGDGLL
jgi:hypothetical protein